MPTIKAMLGSYPHVMSLPDMEHFPQDIYLEKVDPPGTIMDGFRLMARELAYDVSELGLSTAICAKEYDIPLTAIPVFLTRRFDHEGIFVRSDYGISDGKDLEGRNVGVRSYSVTDLVWSCGVLMELYGVDPDKIQWVVTGEEHIAETILPPNAQINQNDELATLLDEGKIDAILSPRPPASSKAVPLIFNPREAELLWVQEKGYVPMHHTVVIKDTLLTDNPGLAQSLFAAFCEAKEKWLQDRQTQSPPADESYLDEFSSLLGPDPFPYGIENNQVALEDFARYAKQLQLIGNSRGPEDYFATVGRI